MAGRERLGLRRALSRLPRWAAALGIVVVLAVLTGIAAFLAMGTSGLEERLGLGRTVTVVLKVDGEPAYLFQSPPIACNAHGGPCDPPDASGIITYTTPTGGTTYQYTALPSTRRVQVPVGGFVTLDAAQDTNLQAADPASGMDVVGCSILLNGKVLSRAKYAKDTLRAHCQATVPSAPSRSPGEEG